MALARLGLILRSYDPNQPRIPAGQSGGGRWTDGDTDDSDPSFDDARIIFVSDENPRSYSVDLEEEEARGGHTLREHVGETDDEMLDRVRSSRADSIFASYGLRRDGSLVSRESATDFINRTLDQNRNEVDSVASGQSEGAFIKSPFGYQTGNEAYAAGYLDPCIRRPYGVGVFIVRDPRSSRDYRIRSAYPRNDGD